MTEQKSTTHVIDEIITPMVAIWGKPRTVQNEDMAISFYVDDLAGFSRDTLKAAFKIVRQRHVYQSWPASAEFVKACLELRGYATDIDDELTTTLQINRRAAEYANQRFAQPEGLAAVEGGYAKQWREYIQHEAAKQLFQGQEPDVQIPAQLLDSFKAQGAKTIAFGVNLEPPTVATAASKIVSEIA